MATDADGGKRTVVVRVLTYARSYGIVVVRTIDRCPSDAARFARTDARV